MTIITAPIKGGPGSGNFGHTGRPGSEGGSVGRGSGSGTKVRDARKVTRSVTFETVDTSEADLEPLMASYGVTRDQVAYMLAADGLDTYIRIESRHEGKNLMIYAKYLDDKGEIAGSCLRFFSQGPNGIEVDHAKFEFEEALQGRDIGRNLYARQIETYKALGVDRIVTDADVSIGKYAWAKMGFDYLAPNETKLRRKNAQFEYWAGKQGIPTPPGGWPTFSHPYEFATYRHPDGVKISSKKLGSWMGSLKPGDYDIGKAFMLDDAGHGSWEGVYRLKGSEE